jgi:hypothetical protein
VKFETEQALGLGRREPKTWHLEVFRANSAQQFRKRNVQNGRAFTKRLPSGKNL